VTHSGELQQPLILGPVLTLNIAVGSENIAITKYLLSQRVIARTSHVVDTTSRNSLPLLDAFISSGLDINQLINDSCPPPLL